MHIVKAGVGSPRPAGMETATPMTEAYQEDENRFTGSHARL
jgi:hypothetical protein